VDGISHEYLLSDMGPKFFGASDLHTRTGRESGLDQLVCVRKIKVMVTLNQQQPPLLFMVSLDGVSRMTT
jgi:hypothetical protein